MKPGGEVLKTPFDMQHMIDDVLFLVILIKSYDEEVKVIMESTGHYHLPAVTVLIGKAGKRKAAQIQLHSQALIPFSRYRRR